MNQIKKFKGLPGGDTINYTDNVWVANGELAFVPKGAPKGYEMIIPQGTKEHKELNKFMAFEEKRPGDRITEETIEQVGTEASISHLKNMIANGDPLFGSSLQGYNKGGINTGKKNKLGLTNLLTGFGSQIAAGLSGLVPDVYQQEGIEENNPITGTVEGLAKTGASFIPGAGPILAGGSVVSDFIDIGRNKAREKGDVAGAQAAALGSGLTDPIGSWGELASDFASDDISTGTKVAAGVANIIPGLGNLIMEPAKAQMLKDKKQREENVQTLNERGFQNYSTPSISSIRVDPNSQTGFGKGGMKRKYSNGGVNQDEYLDTLLDLENQGGMYRDVSYNQDKDIIENLDNQDIILDKDKDFQEYANEPDFETGSDDSNKKWNIAGSVVGGLAQAIPSIAYLAGSGKDYEKVEYPEYTPETLSYHKGLLATKGAFGSAKEAARQQGKLNPDALSLLATKESESKKRVRESIDNLNAQILNDAQRMNIGTTMKAMQDEAANKGQALTNRFAAENQISDAIVSTMRQIGMADSDARVRELFESIFKKGG